MAAVGFQADLSGARFISVSAVVKGEVCWGELLYRGYRLDDALAAAEQARERWRAQAFTALDGEPSPLTCRVLDRQAFCDAMRHVAVQHGQIIRGLALQIIRHVDVAGLPAPAR